MTLQTTGVDGMEGADAPKDPKTGRYLGRGGDGGDGQPLIYTGSFTQADFNLDYRGGYGGYGGDGNPPGSTGDGAALDLSLDLSGLTAPQGQALGGGIYAFGGQGSNGADESLIVQSSTPIDAGKSNFTLDAVGYGGIGIGGQESPNTDSVGGNASVIVQNLKVISSATVEVEVAAVSGYGSMSGEDIDANENISLVNTSLSGSRIAIFMSLNPTRDTPDSSLIMTGTTLDQLGSGSESLELIAGAKTKVDVSGNSFIGGGSSDILYLYTPEEYDSSNIQITFNNDFTKLYVGDGGANSIAGFGDIYLNGVLVNGSLFTQGNDTVDLNSLGSNQLAALKISPDQDLYNTLAGDDSVTLPDSDVTLAPGVTFSTEHVFTAGDGDDTIVGGAGNYTIELGSGGAGDYMVQLGNGISTVSTSGTGKSTINAGTGADTFNFTGGATATISGSGNYTIGLTGAGDVITLNVPNPTVSFAIDSSPVIDTLNFGGLSSPNATANIASVRGLFDLVINSATSNNFVNFNIAPVSGDLIDDTSIPFSSVSSVSWKNGAIDLVLGNSAVQVATTPSSPVNDQTVSISADETGGTLISIGPTLENFLVASDAVYNNTLPGGPGGTLDPEVPSGFHVQSTFDSSTIPGVKDADALGIQTYVNDETKQIIIAYRGTDPRVLDSYALDSSGIYLANPAYTSPIFSAALQYAKAAISSNPGYEYYVTGHSLGGSIAEAVAAGLQLSNDGPNSLFGGGVEFAGTGVSSLVQSWLGSTPSVPNLTDYVGLGDPVATYATDIKRLTDPNPGAHIGTVVELPPTIPGLDLLIPSTLGTFLPGNLGNVNIGAGAVGVSFEHKLGNYAKQLIAAKDISVNPITYAQDSSELAAIIGTKYPITVSVDLNGNLDQVASVTFQTTSGPATASFLEVTTPASTNSFTESVSSGSNTASETISDDASGNVSGSLSIDGEAIKPTSTPAPQSDNNVAHRLFLAASAGGSGAADVSFAGDPPTLDIGADGSIIAEIPGATDGDEVTIVVSPTGLATVYAGGDASTAATEIGQVELTSGDTLDINYSSAGVPTGVAATICHLRGTKILTPAGLTPVEDLNIGDDVITRFGGVKRIHWIGRQSYSAAAVLEREDRMPVRLRRGALGNGLPSADLFVSQGHSLLIDGVLILAKALVNGVTIFRDQRPQNVDYFQLELDAHDCVLAEGVWSETFADGPALRDQFDNAAEFRARHPEYAPPEELQRLCAPRPETGEELQAALRPIVDRASSGRTPGELRGFVDQVSDEGVVEGWAQNLNDPELPVLLEVVHGSEVVGTVLACDFRSDLLDARIGRGRASFRFKPRSTLPAGILKTLKVRRRSETVSEAAFLAPTASHDLSRSGFEDGRPTKIIYRKQAST